MCNAPDVLILLQQDSVVPPGTKRTALRVLQRSRGWSFFYAGFNRFLPASAMKNVKFSFLVANSYQRGPTVLGPGNRPCLTAATQSS